MDTTHSAIPNLLGHPYLWDVLIRDTAKGLVDVPELAQRHDEHAHDGLSRVPEAGARNAAEQNVHSCWTEGSMISTADHEGSVT